MATGNPKPYRPQRVTLDTSYSIDASVAATLDRASRHYASCTRCREASSHSELRLVCAKMYALAIPVVEWWGVYRRVTQSSQGALFDSDTEIGQDNDR